MDFCRNVSDKQESVVSPPCSKLASFNSSLDDLFPAHNTEVDVSLEWLSIFVEDCLSSSGICLPVAAPNTASVQTPSPPKPQQTPPSLEKFVVPSKARRSKRKRTAATATSSSWTKNINSQDQFLDHLTSSDPPLLHQTYWLADSELILPKKEENKSIEQQETRRMMEEVEEGNIGNLDSNTGQQQVQARRCSHCLAQRTPQWRAGPLGPKTLCNACGVRYKSGRLLPEYRPAKSPTFVSYLHSNSHKKVMEMRMTSLPN